MCSRVQGLVRGFGRASGVFGIKGGKMVWGYEGMCEGLVGVRRGCSFELGLQAVFSVRN